MKNDLYAAKVRSCISSFLSKIWTLAVVKNKSLNMRAIVSSKGILVNRLSTFRPTIKFLELNLETSLANENELWTVFSFSGKRFKIETRNLAKSNVDMPIADKMGQKDGKLFVTGLWILARP